MDTGVRPRCPKRSDLNGHAGGRTPACPKSPYTIRARSLSGIETGFTLQPATPSFCEQPAAFDIRRHEATNAPEKGSAPSLAEGIACVLETRSLFPEETSKRSRLASVLKGGVEAVEDGQALIAQAKRRVEQRLDVVGRPGSTERFLAQIAPTWSRHSSSAPIVRDSYGTMSWWESGSGSTPPSQSEPGTAPGTKTTAASRENTRD
jgi:hypothetical protein